MQTKIIAEIGVNHNGNLNTAIKLIDGAKASGANIVKFQYFKAHELVTNKASTAAYQKSNTGIQLQSELLKKLQISATFFPILPYPKIKIFFLLRSLLLKEFLISKLLDLTSES